MAVSPFYLIGDFKNKAVGLNSGDNY
jgi:hypothetical protein